MYVMFGSRKGRKRLFLLIRISGEVRKDTYSSNTVFSYLYFHQLTGIAHSRFAGLLAPDHTGDGEYALLLR